MQVNIEDDHGQSTCAYFVSRKNRSCQMLVSKGKKFCGQHLMNEDQVEDGHAHKKRIPCPLDSKHTCFEHKLSQHMARCNAREKTDIPFFSRGINKGEEDNPPHIQIKSLTDVTLQNYIIKIQQIHAEFVGPIEKRVSSHSVLTNIISRSNYGAEMIRHLKQDSSILAFLDAENILSTSGSKVFVEFGAGRGRLTSCLIEAIQDKENSTFLLIDKSSHRNKVDTKLKYKEHLKFERLRIDIQDLNLSKVECIQNDSIIIAFGKHLCGAATDFSLRCLTECNKGIAGGVIVALCCHHRSTWKSYTGKEFFKTIGFKAEDFPVLVSLTSWAVSASKTSEEIHIPGTHLSPQGHPQECEHADKEEGGNENRYVRMGLTVTFREEIGRKAKQIIDMGRVSFLKGFGMDSALIQYADRCLTLENIALVAVQKNTINQGRNEVPFSV